MPNPFDFFGGGSSSIDRKLAVMEQRLSNIERMLGKVLEVQQQVGGRKLDQLIRGQQQGRDYLMSEAEEIAKLVAAVKANKDVTDSATAALTGLVASVAELNQKLADAVAAGGEDVSPEIKQAAEELQATTEALQAAIPQLAQAVEANT